MDFYSIKLLCEIGNEKRKWKQKYLEYKWKLYWNYIIIRGKIIHNIPYVCDSCWRIYDGAKRPPMTCYEHERGGVKLCPTCYKAYEEYYEERWEEYYNGRL